MASIGVAQGRLPAQGGIVVKQYRYFMDDQHTGTLSLMNTERGNTRCSWRSSSSRLSTDWHGTWGFEPPVTIRKFFDFYGIAVHKWATVSSLSGVGVDYLGRTIRMELLAIWYFDALTATYVLG